MEGALKFKGYTVELINYTRNKNFSIAADLSEAINLIPQFLHKIAIKKDDFTRCNVLLGVMIGDKPNSQIPFHAEVIVRGYFEYKPELENERLEKAYQFYSKNGFAILFPYLRAILTMITSQGELPPIILPTINFGKIVDDSSEEELLLSGDEYMDPTEF